MTLRDELREVLMAPPRKLIGDLARRETIEDLFDHAEYKWGLTEVEVRTSLKAKGHKKFNGMKWDIYIDELRGVWLKKHIAELEAQGTRTVDAHRQELELKERCLTIEVCTNGWKYVGTEEQLAAHWELEEIRRKENMRRYRNRRMYAATS